MELFRKYRFVTVAAVLAAFLVYSGYSKPLLQMKCAKAGDEKIRYTLAHAYPAEYILPDLSHAQNIHVPPVFKCFPERGSFVGILKLLPETNFSIASGTVSNCTQTFLLVQICKLQI
jgi:hypothetical protein